MEAEIGRNGAIRLGRVVACDAHDGTRPVRVVTHAHSDHTIGLVDSMRESEVILMTRPTNRIIVALKGQKYLGGNERFLDYGEPFEYDGEVVTLFLADHILGAAQVLVESQGVRILYTGDFRLPGTPIVNCDVLVMEATYGNPRNVRPFEEEVESTFVSLVERCLKYGPVYVFGYHGKIQEAMRILSCAHVGAPVIVPRRIMNVCQIYREFGEDIGGFISSDSEEGSEILKSDLPYVAFYHSGARRYVGRDAMRIYLSGWEFVGPYRQVGDLDYTVALSDHADFNGLIRYVEESRPRLVITDNHRIGDAKALAREIERRVGIRSVPMP